MTKEIAVIDNTAIAKAFATPSGIDVLIQRIKSEASAEVPDLTTKKGRDRIASLAYKVSKTKTLVDDFGKELVAEEKKRLALIDADRKKWRDECDKLRDEIRKPLTDWEQAEADRIQRHKDAIQKLRELSAPAMGTDSAAISGLIAQAEAVALGDHWQEFAKEAGKAKDETLAILRFNLQRRQQYESEQARLAAERAEFDRRQAEARRQQEEADRVRREAEQAEAARLAAERKAQQDEIDRQAAALRQQQAEFERQQAEAKAEAERAEAAKLAAAEAKKAAKAKAEAEAKLAAEIEAAKPDRERIAGYVRIVLAEVPETGTTIGNHMRADLVEALEGLLTGWGA